MKKNPSSDSSSLRNEKANDSESRSNSSPASESPKPGVSKSNSKTQKILNPYPATKGVNGKPNKSLRRNFSEENESTTLKSVSEVYKTLSCMLQQENRSNRKKKKEISNMPQLDKRIIELKKEEPPTSSSGESVSSMTRKPKSYEYLEKVSSRVLPRTPLAEKVASVLEPGGQQRPVSELDAFYGYARALDEKKTMRQVLDSCTSKDVNLKFNQKIKYQESFGKQKTAEKSQSHLSLKYTNYPRQSCNCYNLENKSKTIQKTSLGYKKNNQKVPVEPQTVNLTKYSSYSHGSSKISPSKMSLRSFNGSQEPFFTIDRSRKNRTWRWAYEDNRDSEQQDEDPTLEARNLESLIRKSRSSIQNTVKKYETRESSGKGEKNVKICQCPHYHTEDGIKKIGLHTCDAVSEYGKKFFRLNYLSVDSDQDSEDEKEFEDKGTSTDPPDFDARHRQKSAKASQKLNPKPSFEEKETPTKTKTIKKSGKKIKTAEIVKPGPKVLLWHNGNQMQALREAPRRKKGGSSAEKKPKGSIERTRSPLQMKESKKEIEEFLESSNEEEPGRKMLEELDLLEKLFTKLNSVERLSRRRNLQAIGGVKTNKKTSLMSKSRCFLANDRLEEEYQWRRRKLRTAIVNHVQNWLKLDFVDS